MTRSGRQLCALTAALGAVVLAGCGLTDPYHPTASTNSATVAGTTRSGRAQGRRAADALDPAPERGGTIPAREHTAQSRLARRGSRTPRQAVLRYALLYLNWTARTLAAHQDELAALAVGPARGQAAQTAAAVPTDETLTRDRVADRGTVISAQRQAGDLRRWVLVTREQTTGRADYRGLPAQLHVTLATVTHTPTGWAVSQWSPQT